MQKTALVLGLCLAVPALADQDWKDLVKQQAGQQMEQQLNLPQPAPTGAKAYLLEPKDGAEVSGPVKVVFGLDGMGVAPAGFNKEGVPTGHFHLLIDDPKIDLAQPLPSSDQVRHYGGGQISATIELKPGKHTLQALVGDWKHQPNNPAVMSDKITITVK